MVAYQMPNWAETLEVLWAGFALGATMVPIIHFYGPAEVAFILDQSGAKALVTVGAFGNVDHVANLASMRGDVDVETIVVADTAARAGVLPGAVALSELADHQPLGATEPGGPGSPGDDRLHVRDDGRAQRRDPLPPDPPGGGPPAGVAQRGRRPTVVDGLTDSPT